MLSLTFDTVIVAALQLAVTQITAWTYEQGKGFLFPKLGRDAFEQGF